jgi:hypothetical protein
VKSKRAIRDKIMKGLELAYEKLLNETAERDGYLVVSENGKIVKVKAKKLLARYKKKGI